jgi:tRNA threonylcarbamoyl adenosine modification protein YeaZ
MKYLFIDTSTERLTIALSTNDKVFAISTSIRKNDHSKYAVSEMKKIFDDASMTPSEIDRIIVVNGPGSFTGVRIGVTIAKTYAWALKKQVIPVSSLLVNTFGYSDYEYYISVINARRDHIYAAIYDKNYQVVLKEQYMSIAAIDSAIETLNGSYIIVGDININNKECNPPKIDLLKTIEYCENLESVMPHSLNPNYLKMVEAEEKLMVNNND